MFEIGDYVVKANSGICKIEEMGRPDIPSISKDKLYFILVPIEEAKTKLYVSVDKAGDSLRKVITEDEAWEIINDIPAVEEAWIAAGKKSTSVDEHFFKLAENYLYTELAFAIGEKKENMKDIIIKKLDGLVVE